MAGRSLDRPVTVRLGGQLAELRNRIGATERRIEEEECLLRDARKRLQTLRAELLQSTEQEAQLVRALGGEEAAAAAAQAAEAADAAAQHGPGMSQQQQRPPPPPPQQHPGGVQHVQHPYAAPPAAVTAPPGHHLPLVVPPGMIVQHLPPPAAGQQPAVVMFHANGQPPGQPGGQPGRPHLVAVLHLAGQQPHLAGQQPVPAVVHAVPLHQLPLHQQPAFVPHPQYPLQQAQQAQQAPDANQLPQQQQHQLAATLSDVPASSAGPPQLTVQPQHNGHAPALCAAPAIPAGAAPHAQIGFSALPGGVGPAVVAGNPTRTGSAGSVTLVHTSQEFVPRALQLAAQPQQAQQQQQQTEQQGATADSQDARAAPAAATEAPPRTRGAAFGGPPGFGSSPAHCVRKGTPLEASPLAPFPVPGRTSHVPPQRQQQGAGGDALPAGEGQGEQEAGGSAAAGAAYEASDAPGTENDAALAAALAECEGLGAAEDALSTAMGAAALGGGPLTRQAGGRFGAQGAGAGRSGGSRSWGRGSSLAGGAGRAPGMPAVPPAGAADPSAVPAAEDFPSLTAAPAAAAAAPPAGGPRGWGNATALQSLRSKLAEGSGARAGPGATQRAQQAQQAQHGAAAPGGQAAEDFEARCGLRVVDDGTPDTERRRLVKRQTFQHMEKHLRTRQPVDVLGGLELHCNVLSPDEQVQLVEAVEHWVALGKAGRLRGRTFSAPKKWLPGKGRVTMQFGCCYNYATDSQGRPPGIIPEEVVEPMPPPLRALCRRLTRWRVLPEAREPNSAIINIYEPGDCIPPHVDHFDFIRPFCTLSLLSEQRIMFGQKLVPAGPGEFVAQGGEPAYIPLPTGSCLVLKGYGGDTAMHCVPPVAARRISITLRRMGSEHDAAVGREVRKLEAAQGFALRGFWEEAAPTGEGAGTARRGVVIK